jgi:hypothetical protein
MNLSLGNVIFFGAPTVFLTPPVPYFAVAFVVARRIIMFFLALGSDLEFCDHLYNTISLSIYLFFEINDRRYLTHRLPLNFFRLALFRSARHCFQRLTQALIPSL